MNISTLDFNLFKPFIAVYENKNIARAAKQLALTPSAVSMRLKELSHQLGCSLFTPHARGVHPTKEADELYRHVMPAVAVLNRTSENIAEFTANTQCVIRLGCATNIAKFVLLDFICDFMKKFPKTQISIRSESRNNLCDMLAKRDIDVLVYRLPIIYDKDYITVERLCDLHKAFFASHDFMQKHNIGTTITCEQLAKLPVVSPDKMRDDAQFIVKALNKPLDTFIDISDIIGGNELVYSITKKGMAIGYFNEHCVTPYDKISKITVQNLSLPMHALGVAYPKGETSKPILTFINSLKCAIKHDSS